MPREPRAPNADGLFPERGRILTPEDLARAPKSWQDVADRHGQAIRILSQRQTTQLETFSAKFAALEQSQFVLSASYEVLRRQLAKRWELPEEEWQELLEEVLEENERAAADAHAAATEIEAGNRCAVCGWPLAEEAAQGCVRGNCSQRPWPKQLFDPARAKAEAPAASLKCQEAWTGECQGTVCRTCDFCQGHAFEANRQGEGRCPDCREISP